MDGQIDRADGKVVILIMESDVTQLQRFPVREGVRARKIRAERRQRKLIQFSEGHLCTEQRRQRTHGGEQRRTQEQQRQ
ncbi:hypothetical protein D3C72_1319280 [compost metagenome]